MSWSLSNYLAIWVGHFSVR